MRSISVQIVFSLLMAAMLLGCGTNNVGLDPGSTHGTSGFTLNVLPGSFYGGAVVGDFSLEVTDYGDSTMVDIKATGAENLRGIYFDLEFDAQTMRPMIVNPTTLLGDQDDMVNVQVFSERGHVHYGQMLTHPDLRPGFSGDGVVTQVLFKNEPALNTRLVSAAPNSPSSAQILDTNIDTELSWWYANQGDYDQNSEVNISDITPIVLNIFKTGPWAVEMQENVVDGDNNNEINTADITPIVLYITRRAREFHIYSSADAADYTNDTGTIVQILFDPGIVLQSDFVVPIVAGGRLMYSVPIADIDGFDPARWYWVYPSSDGSDLGTKSNLVGGVGVPRSIISLTNIPPPDGGPGDSIGSPWDVDITTDYTFSLTDPDVGDVTNDVNTIYIVSDPAAGSIATPGTGDPFLNIEDAYTGTFNVTATYNGTPAENSIWFIVGADPVGLFIMKDETDADWASVNDPGGATSDNPYILGVSGGFNADYLTEFSMVANTMADGLGDVIPNNTLTWVAFPPFGVDWTGDGTFEANMFTGDYIFAQDGDSNNSNNVYVVHQSLPDS